MRDVVEAQLSRPNTSLDTPRLCELISLPATVILPVKNEKLRIGAAKKSFTARPDRFWMVKGQKNRFLSASSRYTWTHKNIFIAWFLACCRGGTLKRDIGELLWNIAELYSLFEWYGDFTMPLESYLFLRISEKEFTSVIDQRIIFLCLLYILIY